MGHRMQAPATWQSIISPDMPGMKPSCADGQNHVVYPSVLVSVPAAMMTSNFQGVFVVSSLLGYNLQAGQLCSINLQAWPNHATETTRMLGQQACQHHGSLLQCRPAVVSESLWPLSDTGAMALQSWSGLILLICACHFYFCLDVPHPLACPCLDPCHVWL